MDTDHARARLAEDHERLQAIQADLAVVREESEEDSIQELSSHAQHQADLGSETFDREKDLSILDQVEADLADIEHALRRLDDGTYGTCEACGKAIGDERLEAMPAARFCLDDQALAEQESRAHEESA
ncbi:MAG TPA: TraR/DksA C4-type zinc finger protein [Acidimicrobiales bacterium]|nr:TraR/DksA C4-type zinc finger protein [Acidimicrobiales bacterium]